MAMSDYILVAVAWPNGNADIHVGNLAGAYLPADIFARYYRLLGNNVLMVSGTDAHGTPITVTADREGTAPQAIYERFHRRHLNLLLQLGIAYDLYTSTHTENHFRVAQDVFLKLKDNGWLFTQWADQWYSPRTERFLPDRYVEGECPFCHYENARGDQCDQCGNLIDATELIAPRATITGDTLELRATEHFYLDLRKFRPLLSAYLHSGKEHWRANTLHPSRHMVDSGRLHGRAITRDLDWGIPVPLQSWEGKCLYVWFEDVIGYLSASIEWAKNQGEPEAWKAWWYEPGARSYYFVGKDNIPFHTLIWPAELLGIERVYDQDRQKRLNLPYDVPANEFLNLQGRRISGSRNWAVWGLDLLTRYEPDPLRYYLTVNMPETRDANWEWTGFVQHNNAELVAKWGNLAHRVLTFAHRQCHGCVPVPGELRAADRTLLEKVEAGFDTVGRLLSAVRLRAALQAAVSLASEVNRYLDQQRPWFEIKEDQTQAAKTVYTTLRAVDSLKLLFAPFLPSSSEALHVQLGYRQPLFGTQSIVSCREEAREHEALIYDGASATGRWQASQLPAGQRLRQPAPLFKKLSESIVEAELQRLQQSG
jgi:methionyl-tRNA synthetase